MDDEKDTVTVTSTIYSFLLTEPLLCQPDRDTTTSTEKEN